MKTTLTKKKATVETVEIEIGQKISEKNQKQLQNIFQHAPAAIAVFDGPQHRFVMANQAYQKQNNRKEIDFLGKSFREVFPELEGTGSFEIFDKVFETGETFTALEYAAMIDSDNNGIPTQHYFNFSLESLRNESEEIYGVMVMAYDITEQVLVRKKNEEREVKYKSLIGAAPIGIGLLMGKDLILESANQKYMDLIGKGNDIEGKKFIAIMPELVGQPYLKILDNIFITGKIYQSFADPVSVIRNGILQHEFYDIDYAPLFDGEGKVYAILNIATDVTIQTQLNIKIKESEKQFKNVLLQSPNIFVILEGFPKMIISFANEPLLKSWGRTAAIIGKPLLEALPEIKDQPFPKLLQQVFDTGITYYSGEEKAVIIKNGVAVDNYYNYVYQAIFDNTQKVTGVIIMATDITEQVEARKKIEESEKRKTFLLKLSDAMRLLSNPVEIEQTVTKIAMDFMDADRCYYCTIEEGNAIVLCDAFRDGLTSLAAVYLVSDFALLIAAIDSGHPFVVDDVNTSEIVEEGLKQMCMQVQVFSMINVPIIKNGRALGVFVLAHSKPRKWTKAEVQLCVETAERIWASLERAKAEEALSLSEEKFRTLFNSINQGFTFCELIRNKEGKGIDLTILEVNSTYEKQTGVPKEMVIGKPFLQVFPSLDRWIETYAAVVDNQCPTEFENYFEDTDRWFAIKAYPVEKERFTVLFDDITERKKAEDKIRKSEKQFRELSTVLEQKVHQRTIQLKQKNTNLQNMNKELEAFTYVSSHDLQEPLRKIQTFAGMILEKENQNLSDKGKNYFLLIQNSANQMQQLINDLLAFSRLNATERKYENTDLNIIIEEVKKEFEEVIAEKHAVIEVKEICEVHIIVFQFRQLMHNLISNALKFSNPKRPPHIKITSQYIKYDKLNIKALSRVKEYCHITITDNGIGFEKEFSTKIFEVFQRLHGKEEYTGTGIGLAIVKKIVDNHNGIITATSELDKGATFNIYLPVAKRSDSI